MPILQWLTRDQDLTAADRVPYRLLEEVAELSVPASGPAAGPAPGTGGDNLLVQGDNLEALRALLPLYAGRVKCIYIDPPYNTGSAFEHYDDSLEHAKWLAMMVPRLQLLREFLSEDGSIWATIDDNEGHYLKVVMDEVFGRRNFMGEVIWRNSDNSNNNVTKFSQDHNTILVYSRQVNWGPNFLNDPTKRKHFKNPDNDPRGPWFDGNPVNNPGLRPSLQYNIVSPQGHTIKHPPNGWRWSRETISEKLETGELRFSKDGTRLIRRTYLADMKGLPPSTLWTDVEVTGHNRAAKYELKKLFPNVAVTSLFTTPKPERLIQRILDLATNPGDLVFDSFLGSGTTAAVAHKMGRRWIGVEMGDHARTHCALRLRKVIEGEQGGISRDVGWQGGGGFRFCTLGATVFDGAGRINPEIRFADLARHLWFTEFRVPMAAPDVGQVGGPFLGAHDGRGLALLYNGILRDRTAGGGNVLTHAVLRLIREGAQAAGWDGPITVYGAANRLSERTLAGAGMSFRQTPYDIRARV
ncbi:site-specific DNA-methyltransferase [Rhodobaculum claviforme]|uniref:site-specific DNA-methyltransferase (adenine-specific) n=2 Tax=Rhodobaculum claviforme TaxID=1549854 RepID=A0A934TLU4_9RHOB|nr:site-specific DNA-methyltransferase [Rhodobaculum claviforme]